MFASLLGIAPNGERYLRVGGTRQRHFDGTDSKPRNLPENAARPTRRVHALLGGVSERQTVRLKKDSTAKSITLWHAPLLFATDKNHTRLKGLRFKDSYLRKNDLAAAPLAG